MSVDFTHLHVHTQYSLLDGASKPKELLQRAMELDMDSIAVTDHGNMYGVIDMYKTARSLSKEAAKEGRPGIKVIFGCECYVAPESRFDRIDKQPRYHLILLAENNEGYQNLAHLVSLGFIEGFYRKPRIDKAILRQYSGKFPTLFCSGIWKARNGRYRNILRFLAKIISSWKCRIMTCRKSRP